MQVLHDSISPIIPTSNYVLLKRVVAHSCPVNALGTVISAISIVLCYRMWRVSLNVDVSLDDHVVELLQGSFVLLIYTSSMAMMQYSGSCCPGTIGPTGTFPNISPTRVYFFHYRTFGVTLSMQYCEWSRTLIWICQIWHLAITSTSHYICAPHLAVCN